MAPANIGKKYKLHWNQNSEEHTKIWERDVSLIMLPTENVMNRSQKLNKEKKKMKDRYNIKCNIKITTPNMFPIKNVKFAAL